MKFDFSVGDYLKSKDWSARRLACMRRRVSAGNRAQSYYATAHQWYAEYLTAMGRFDEALTEIRRAKEIDPLSPNANAGEV
ncbi:MAG: hypothetical protein LC778_17440 [Acidobacteria bacterium]|nr:hypothetical protein [Acidobacteriota bacterium]